MFTTALGTSGKWLNFSLLQVLHLTSPLIFQDCILYVTELENPDAVRDHVANADFRTAKGGEGLGDRCTPEVQRLCDGRPCAGLCTWLFYSRASLLIDQAIWLSAQLPGILAKLLSTCQPDEVEGKEKQNLHVRWLCC